MASFTLRSVFVGNSLQPLQFPDRVTVLHKLRDKPLPSTDHFALDVVILSELHQRPAARSVEDIVVYDYKKAAKTPLKPFMVETLTRIWDEQEETKRISNKQVTELLERLERLEKGTWDNEGAVEKFGAS